MKDSLKEFAGLVRDYVFDAYYPSEGGTGRIRSAVASLAGEEVALPRISFFARVRRDLTKKR